jgi:signal transduction histidine kinase
MGRRAAHGPGPGRPRARAGEGGAERPPPAWGAAALSELAAGSLGTEAFALDLPNRAELTRELDRYLDLEQVYDLVLLVAKDGRLVTCTSRNPVEGSPLSERLLQYLFAYDYRQAEWFSPACEGGEFTLEDHHLSPFHLQFDHGGPVPLDPAWDFHIGFAAPIRSRTSPGAVIGVLYGVVNWKFVQDIVSTQVITDAFRGLVREGREPSPYAWLWDEDANLILAHQQRDLYTLRVDEDLGLGALRRAVLAELSDPEADGWGLFPEYRFQGELKSAAFRACRARAAAGFGWVVGVGIENEDIFATAEELRSVLLAGTAVVLAVVVALALLISRRTTGPIQVLQQQVRRVAGGDLDARIELRTRDELGALAEDFNRMTSELKAQRERIVKAEKDAAWREMARQIAHDIKNPLTPITLSLDLLERARRERAPGSEAILERTMSLVRRQVEHLRQIAGEFYEFTGGRRARPCVVDVSALLEEVLHLHDAWAVERGVEVRREVVPAEVWADPGKLRRVLVNLVTNALQAMPEGGTLSAAVSPEGARVLVSIRDTGVGLSSEARAHLFEPYFTTKSEGTGLGLAISKRAIEEMGGEIELGPAPGEPGTVARLSLPHHRGGAAG